MTMSMYFETTMKLKHLLFEGLNVTTNRDFASLCVVAFMVTVIFEALIASKAIVMAKRKMNPLTLIQDEDLDNSSFGSSDRSSSQAELLSSLRIPTNVGVVRKQKFQLFALESLIHMCRFAYGYMLMLLVMTYNVWLFIAVLLGTGVGYFIFHPMTVHASHVYSRLPSPHRSALCEGDSVTQSHDVMPPSSLNNGQNQPLISHA